MGAIVATITTETTEGVQVGLPILVTLGTIDMGAGLPAQTGNADAILGTDGTDPAWVRSFKSGNGQSRVAAEDDQATLYATDGVGESQVRANPDGTVEINATGAATLNGDAIATATDVAAKVSTSRTISTTAPLSGGGDLSANRTLTIADATTSVKGAVQLTDSTSSTSTTTAATPNSVKSAYDLASAHKTRHATGGSDALSPSDIGAASAAAVLGYHGMSTSVLDTAPRVLFSGSSQTLVSGTVFFVYVTPLNDIVVANLVTATVGTAASGLTLARMGIYSVSGTTRTLVARTASDTALWASTNTAYTRALNTTGGYPSTYTMVAGTRYALAVLAVGTTMPALSCLGSLGSGMGGLDPVLCVAEGSQSDLPTSSTATGGSRPYWLRATT